MHFVVETTMIEIDAAVHAHYPSWILAQNHPETAALVTWIVDACCLRATYSRDTREAGVGHPIDHDQAPYRIDAIDGRPLVVMNCVHNRIDRGFVRREETHAIVRRLPGVIQSTAESNRTTLDCSWEYAPFHDQNTPAIDFARYLLVVEWPTFAPF